MTRCTVNKCFPAELPASLTCSGQLVKLTEFSYQPRSYLEKTCSAARSKADDPNHYYQILLSHVTGAAFTEAELQSFTICEGHEVCAILLAGRPVFA